MLAGRSIQWMHGEIQKVAGDEQTPDPERLKAYLKLVFSSLGGAVTAAMISLGDRMGLYRALAEGGSGTSIELASRTGLSERWLREWLYQQGAAGVIEYQGDGRFSLTAEGRAVLADESHPAFGAGMFDTLPEQMTLLERLPEAFESGIGLDYDALGSLGARGIERGFAPWFRNLLVPFALPRIEGVVPRLEAGCAVADVGCGTGVALIEMAKAFPRSEFHGYDISSHALVRAELNRAEADVLNVFFHDAANDPLPGDGRFGFVTTFDCLHDMTDPAAVMTQVRASIKEDGVWLVADIKAHDSYEENVERNPMAALMYGTSVLTCLSSSLSEPGGLGLGTLGFSENTARKMMRAAGFTQFEPIEFGHPVNAFYLIQP